MTKVSEVTILTKAASKAGKWVYTALVYAPDGRQLFNAKDVGWHNSRADARNMAETLVVIDDPEANKGA